MIVVDNIETFNFEGAIRGMRNPMNSWSRCDSVFENGRIISVGPNDLNLMQRLYSAGSEHRKYLRQIFVSMDVTAPLYWWKEMDTYKIGTVANSCSTMHKLAYKEFELDDFSHEHLCEGGLEILKKLIYSLNTFREAYNDTANKDHWWQMIQLLPSSYNQKRTLTMNYENVVSIIHQRNTHKLDEWHTFVYELQKLPYVQSIMSGVD